MDTPPPPPLSGSGPNHKTGLLVGLPVSFAVVLLVILAVLIWFHVRRQHRKGDEERREEERQEEGNHINDQEDEAMGDQFAKAIGPRRFAYSDLARATGRFSESHKLGEGGFGSVYRGFLSELGLHVAIKRISKSSNQGRKEFIAEVKIISLCRHKNLVKLIGWCHGASNFLLVYELLPNGSLDNALYNAINTVLPWGIRYKIVLGLASALVYLHQELEECILHRDIKPSNIMLDGAFNAKLGDFGLARLLENGRKSCTTGLAGTRGYMDPEYFTCRKANTEADIRSFGIVLLNIATGKGPTVDQQNGDTVPLVDWVWEFHRMGSVLGAADEALGGNFNDQEMAIVLSVGMLCSQIDSKLRPDIRAASTMLHLDVPVPPLPSEMPLAGYYMPPVGDASGSSINSRTS